MRARRRLAAAITGTAFIAVCCFTPILVLVLAALGWGAATQYLDYVLFPALAVMVFITLFAGVTFTSPAGITIRSLVGGLLVFLGLMQTGVLPFSLHAVSELAQPLARWQAHLRRERPVAGFGVFGFAYVLAGFG